MEIRPLTGAEQKYAYEQSMQIRMQTGIGVSEAQLRFVTNTSSGMGLMKCGNVVIPFDNTIEKGTDLYNLYNTNIHEKIAMQKKSRDRADVQERE